MSSERLFETFLEIKYWVNRVHRQFILSIKDKIFSKFRDKYIRPRQKNRRRSRSDQYFPWLYTLKSRYTLIIYYCYPMWILLLVFDKLGLRKRPPAPAQEKEIILWNIFTSQRFLFLSGNENLRNTQRLTKITISEAHLFKKYAKLPITFS